MFRNMKLYDQWKIIFNQNIDDEQRNILVAMDINNLQDLFQKFQKQYLKNQKDIDSFDLVKLLQCLGECEENILLIYQTLVKSKIISIDHLKLAYRQDYIKLGLGQTQQQLIEQEIINFSRENSDFYQMIKLLNDDKTQLSQVKAKLLSMGVNSIESLFELTINQIDQLGLNKFEFKTQQDLYDNKQLKQSVPMLNSIQSSLPQKVQPQINKANNIETNSVIIVNQPKIDDNKNRNFQQQYTPINVQERPQIIAKDIVERIVNDDEIEKLIKVSKQIGQKNNFTLYQYPLFKRNQLKEVEAYKSMIVIGQTGSGKTTLLNFFLNYYLDIKFTDNFRFILIDEKQGTSQAVGQTQSVNIYYVQPFNGKIGIRLIDTPGFGDSRIGQDEIIGNQIKECFKNDVESLSAICFLVQSSNARLTPNQNYILSCILAMFGNDIIQNFVFMLTFCDAGDPQALDALKFQGQGKLPCSPVANMVNSIKHPWYLKLNSSALMSPNSDQITKFFWEIAMTSFGEFYNLKLMINIPQSLFLTKEVIREREEIITIIQNIRPKIEQQLNQIENIKNTHYQIQCLSSRIVDSSNYKIKSKQFVIAEQKLKQGEHTTNCIICNVTCHFPCYIPEDKDKASCSAMKDNFCQQCNGKCKWNQHKNMTFVYISISEDVETELAELKLQFFDSKSKKTQKEQILDGIENLYIQEQIECMELQQKLMISVNRLKQIALQPGCCQFQEDYVEIMIKEEMMSKKDGYLERVTELEEIKSNWKFIRELTNNQGGIQITKKFIEDNIPKDKIKQSLAQKISKWYNQWLQ